MRLWKVSPERSSKRQPVGHRHAGGRDHVRRTRADRGRGDHDLASAHRLRVGDRSERHALLVLPADRRQLVARLVEREAEAGDVAVAEDREHTREERRLATVDHRPLGDQEADDRLRGRQSDGLHRTTSKATGTTSSQLPEPHERIRAACTAT